MADPIRRLARTLHATQRSLEALARVPQIAHSTVPTSGRDAPIGDVLTDSADTTAALPDLYDDAATTGDTADTAGNSADEVATDSDEARDAALAAADAALAEAEALLEVARAELEERLDQLGTDLGASDGRLTDAQERLDRAFGRLATAETDTAAARTAADNAAAAAATAKAAADEADKKALAASGLAASKGEVIRQVSAPTGSRANPSNLWIRASDNVPHTYDVATAKWVAATDKAATDAAATAAKAQSDATAAATAAATAQKAADGKPVPIWSTSAPTTSNAAPQGSTWFRITSTGDVLAQWQQTASGTGSTWAARPIASDAIAGLDVGKLRAGTAELLEVVAQKIAAATAAFQRADIANLYVTQGATMQQAVIDELFARVVKAKTLTVTEAFIGKDALLDGAVTARTIAADAFTGKTFTGAKFNGVTMTGATLRTADSGQRLELTGPYANFYNSNDEISGSIQALPGRLLIGSGWGNISIGDMAADGLSADLYAAAARFDGLVVQTHALADHQVQLGRHAEKSADTNPVDWRVGIRARGASINRLYIKELYRQDGVGGNLLGPAVTPSVRATNQANQGIPHSTAVGVAVPSSTEAGGFTKATSTTGTGSRWVVPETGWYSASMSLIWASANGGIREVSMVVGGETITQSSSSVTATTSLASAIATTFYATAGQSIEFRAFQNRGDQSGANLTSAVRSVAIRYLGKD